MLLDLNIDDQETLFYYYQNWKAGLDNKIHKATCGHCRYGSGRNHNQIISRGENGIWIGPFSTIDLCSEYVGNSLKKEIYLCNCCNSEQKIST